MKTVACVIARSVSTRLPLKVFRQVCEGYSMLDFILQRLKRVKGIDEIYLCTSQEPVDDIMQDVAERNKVNVFRGSADAVIDRMLNVGRISGATNLLRITGDNVFTSYEYMDRQIELLKEKNLDYIRLVDAPLGATAEVMTYTALKRCYESMDPSVSEYLMLYIFEPKNFKCGTINVFGRDLSNINLSVDHPEDLVRTKEILDHFKSSDKLSIQLTDIVKIIESNKITAAYMQPGEKIRLPYNKEVSYEEFKKDIERRISQSEQISL